MMPSMPVSGVPSGVAAICRSVEAAIVEEMRDQA